MNSEPNQQATVLLREITARRRAEEALRKHQERLEDLVAERTAEHDKMRAEFVSNVSHELKTPLAALSLALQNLLTGVICPHMDRSCRSYIELMEQSCLRMQETVEDILDMSRIDAGTLQLGRMKTSLTMLVQRVVASLQPHMTACSLRIAVALPADAGFVECDRQRIERVLLNVLGNAIKFTPEGGEIRISLRLSNDLPGFGVLETEDNGVGISREHLPHIGERYYQGDHEANGTGLGLAISREILKLHGGTLYLVSPPPGKQRGTLVTIRLPTVDPPELMLIGPGELSQTISAQLECYGFIVTAYRNGAEAIAAMRRSLPYAAILDLSTAALDNAGLIPRIKQDSALLNVPLIALTETDIPETKRLILAGFTIPAWRKPWSESDLYRVLEVAVLAKPPLSI